VSPRQTFQGGPSKKTAQAAKTLRINHRQIHQKKGKNWKIENAVVFALGQGATEASLPPGQKRRKMMLVIFFTCPNFEEEIRGYAGKIP
jgi:hypothetical protein